MEPAASAGAPRHPHDLDERLHPAPRLADVVGPAPWVTPALEALCGGALAKAPGDRFGSAAIMRACLDDAFLALP